MEFTEIIARVDQSVPGALIPTEDEVHYISVQPEHWLAMMRESIVTGARFTSQRMLREYCELYYDREVRNP